LNQFIDTIVMQATVW